MPEDEQQDRDHLRDHLDLAERRRRQSTTPREYARLRSTVTANSRPMMTATIQAGARPICTSEMKRRRDEQLVGERIHQLPEGRDLLAAARQVAVEPVGERGQPEDGRADELLADAENQPPLELRQQHDHEQRHEEDPGERERVRQIHPGDV